MALLILTANPRTVILQACSRLSALEKLEKVYYVARGTKMTMWIKKTQPRKRSLSC